MKARKKERNKEIEAADKIAKKAAREAAAEEEKRLERLPLLTAPANKYIHRVKEVDRNTLLKEIKRDKEIKLAVLRDVLKRHVFKVPPAEIRSAKKPQLMILFVDVQSK